MLKPPKEIRPKPLHVGGRHDAPPPVRETVIEPENNEIDIDKKIIEGYLDVYWEDTSIGKTLEEAGHPYQGEKLNNLLEPFNGKRVRITVEVLGENAHKEV